VVSHFNDGFANVALQKVEFFQYKSFEKPRIRSLRDARPRPREPPVMSQTLVLVAAPH
jgi:hypothetical protein